MKKADFKLLKASFLTPLYGYALVLCPHEDSASSLLLDTYSVFLGSKKGSLKASALDRVSIYNELLGLMWMLAKKRQLSSETPAMLDSQLILKYGEFFELGLHDRALLFMKEKLVFSLDRCQKALKLERLYILERLASAKSKLLAKTSQPEALGDSSCIELNMRFKIQAFIEKRLDARTQNKLRDLIAHDPNLKKIHEEKLKRYRAFQARIPFIRPEASKLKELSHSVDEVIDGLWHDEKDTVAAKMMRVLDTTVFHLP